LSNFLLSSRIGSVAGWLGKLGLGDALVRVVSQKSHSPLLRRYRLEAVEERARWMCLIIALVSPVWIVGDALLLPAPAWQQLSAGRLGAMVFLGLLWFWRRKGGSPESNAFLVLGALVAWLCVWEIFTMAALRASSAQVPVNVADAHFYETYILATGIAIFPLTLIESATLLAPIMVVMWVNARGWPAQPELVATFAALFRLLFVGSVAIFASAFQLESFVRSIEESAHDRLTLLINRKFGEELLRAQLRIASRRGNPCTVLFLDIDNFKAVNDRFGHQIGDRILFEVAQSLRRVIRIQDVPIRWGGEEFLVMLIDLDAPGAIAVIERLAIAGIGATPDGRPITASIGVVQADVDPEPDVARLVAQADLRMYAAKRAGRNRYAFDDTSLPFIKLPGN
jgi:diguanylate cyclase (GGDEF)-like protein